METAWLRDLLKTMQRDISEIKKDVKGLQKSKFMFEGAKETIRLVATVLVTLFTLWMSHK